MVLFSRTSGFYPNVLLSVVSVKQQCLVSVSRCVCLASLSSVTAGGAEWVTAGPPSTQSRLLPSNKPWETPGDKIRAAAASYQPPAPPISCSTGNERAAALFWLWCSFMSRSRWYLPPSPNVSHQRRRRGEDGEADIHHTWKQLKWHLEANECHEEETGVCSSVRLLLLLFPGSGGEQNWI